ncbi:MAG: AAA family ATPase [Deltaproteobacteria bacterium]|nr:AAA family ATPase [Deltaproteobacteria bacterium]
MNFLLIGKPGSGKTTAACTGRHPTLLLDVDGKAGEMQNLRPLVEEGLLTIHTFNAKLVEDRLKDRALDPKKPLRKMPQGYLEVVEYLNRIIDDEEEFQKYNTVVLDSVTRLAEHMKRLLIYHRGQGKFGKGFDGDMNWPSWGSYLANMEELFTAATTMRPDFICTAHELMEVERDPLTEVEIVRGYWALIDGQMRRKLSGYFNETYFMEIRQSKLKPTEYLFRTRGTKYCARTSMELDELEPANILAILKKGGCSI